jgi:hypothetical protein
VAGCNTSNICAALSPASASASPYTVPAAPAVSASASNTTINASWSGGGGGGRAINHYSVCFQGVACTSYPTAGSASHDYGTYSTAYSVTVTAVDAAGQTSAAGSSSATTGGAPASPPPSPTVTASEGASAQGQPGCSSSACHYIVVTLSNFSGNVACSFNSREGASGFVNETFGNGSHQTYDYYGYHGGWVTATCGGITSGQATWA